jgi:hypothetical protein
MFVRTFYFVSYYVSYYVYWIEYDDYFLFYFQETYNNRLRERYGDDILTHPEFDPDLWMEVGSSGGPDKNRVYGLSNTTADNLQSTRSVSTVGSSQGAPNQYRAPNLRSSWPCSNTRLSSPTNTTTYQRSTHDSKCLMHNKEQSLSKSKRLKHNKKRSMNNKRRLMNNKKRLMKSFAKWLWTWQIVEHVRLILFGRITTSLLLQDLLLLLQLHLYINL